MKKINFTSAKVSNFLSIGTDPIEINFLKGLNIITGKNLDKEDRRNGVGKSSVAQAIYWGIFGETLEELNNEHIINNITNETLKVELNFNVNNEIKYKIIRTLKPSKCFLYVNDEDKTLDTIGNTTQEILNILGCTKDVFRNCIIMTMNCTVPFMAQKKTEKRKFIESIFNLEIFGKMLEISRKEFNEDKKNKELSETQFREIQISLENYIKQKEQFILLKNKRLQDLDVKRVQLIGEIINLEASTAILKEINKDLVLKTQEDALKRELSELTQKIYSIQTDITTLNNETNNAKAKIQEINSSKNKLNSTLSILKESLKDITGKNPSLELKKYDLENEDEVKLQKTNDGIVKLKEYIAGRNNSKETINNTITKLSKEVQTITKNTSFTCSTCKRPFDNAEELKKHTESEINRLNEEIAKNKTELVTIEEQLKTTNEKLEKFLEAQNKFTANIKKLKEDIEKNNTNFNDYNTKLLGINDKIKFHEEALTQVSDDKPFCSLLVDNEVKLSGKNSELVIHSKNKLELEEKLVKETKEIEENNKKYNQYINELNSFNQKISLLKVQVEDIKVSMKKEEETDLDIDKLIAETTTKYTNLRDKVDELGKMLEVKKIASVLFGEEGIKPVIIKKMLNLLNERMGYYLKKIDSNLKISFNEYFEESILSENGKEYTYYNLSGAERKGMDLACLFSFSDIRKILGQPIFNFSIFDELLDSSFDETGIEHILKLLNDKVQESNESIYIISHRKESGSFVTGELVSLEKKSGITRRV